MNNKGFTLVELLAIVVIISIIATVAVPNITNEINSSDKHTQNVVDESIENASKLYVAKYYAMRFINGEEIKFTLNDLENDGLLNLKSGVCEGFKNKDIVVNNHVYDYKELTPSCYSKKSDGSALAPTPSPTPATEKISITAISSSDSYKVQNEELFKRAMHYIIDEKKVVDGVFDGKIPVCSSTDVMCYESNNLHVNAEELMKYYSNKRFNDFSNVEKNLYNDGNSRQFTITYDSTTKTYNMGLCDRQTGSYYGYQYEATYSEEAGFNFGGGVKKNNVCTPIIRFYCCDFRGSETQCEGTDKLEFKINTQFTCSTDRKGVEIYIENGSGLAAGFSKKIITTNSDKTKQFKFKTTGERIIYFKYGGLTESKKIRITN